MTWKRCIALIVLVIVVGIGGMVLAQQRRGGGRRGGGGFGGRFGGDIPIDRNGVPTWKVDSQFKNDVFTFVRVQYDSYGGRGGWLTDYPDSDLNFPFRLQQMTSLKVDPDPKIHRLTDDEIFNYPFLYMLEVGGLVFSQEEIEALRRYCFNGGFLMIDDFWGEAEWQNCYQEIKRVFPDREPVDLPLEHPIFHCVFDLKEKPQVPSINVAENYRGTGITWERNDAREVHYRAVFDDKGRIMVLICQNTDLGDGWEREGESEYYFHEFSEKRAYPMGINIVFYVMTH